MAGAGLLGGRHPAYGGDSSKPLGIMDARRIARTFICLGLAACGDEPAGPSGTVADIRLGGDTDVAREVGPDASTAPEDAAPDAEDISEPDAEPLAPCPSERPRAFDYGARGPHAVGVRTLEDSVFFDGSERGLLWQIVYPATADGEDTPVASDGGPYPFLVFEHAGGSRYDQYNWFFDVLASRGWVIVSAEHDSTGWHGGTDAWTSHAALASMATDRLIGWSEDESSEWFGSIDTDRIVLGGHSHGGGAMLRLMQDWRPMNPDGTYEVSAVLLITTRPDLDRDFASYQPSYAGMAPTLNVGASLDQDGTTAYGEAIGVYEPHGRPAGMIYVEGAEHYSFTDEIGDGAAQIDRQAAIDAATQSIVAFLAATVEGDRAALAALRGDASWTGFDERIVRPQWHDADVIVIDAFESEPSEERASGAIVGIPDQTFVNGFLGDSLADADAHVALLSTELAELLPDGGDVLFYQDGSRGEDSYARALAANGTFAVTSVSAEDEFATRIADGEWDLIVSTRQDGNRSHEAAFDAPLADWICAGGRAIVADFRVSSAGASRVLGCAGAAYDGTTNWTRVTSTGELFTGELTARNPGWGIFTYGLSTSHTVHATNEGEVAVDRDPTVSDIGRVVTADGFVRASEFWAVDRARGMMLPTWALELAWDRAGAAIEWDLGGVDAREHPVLSLRALMIHDDPLNAGDPIDIDVIVEDEDGDNAAWSLDESLQGALGGTPSWLERTVPKSVFETWRVPLRALAERVPALDLDRLVAVRIVTQSGSGAIVVDDLEFSAGEGCW